MKPENDDAPEDQSGDAKSRNQEQRNTYQRKAIEFAIVESGIWNNPKVVEAGPSGALHFIFALTRNAARGRTGLVPRADLAAPYVARQLGVPVADTKDALQACADANLLDFDSDPANVIIVGWDESWKRAPLSEAERIRKADYRARKRTEAEQNEDPKKRKEREKQKQNKNVRDKSRTPPERVWGLAMGQSLWPPMSKEEEENAWNIIRTIRWYLTNTTSQNHSTDREREHLVWLMRLGGYSPPERLERFAAYMCDEEGAGWAERVDSDGNYPMRSHCTVFGLFTEKNLAKHFSTAVDWAPAYSNWKPRIVEKKAS